jgi:hypothetical protein
MRKILGVETALPQSGYVLQIHIRKETLQQYWRKGQNRFCLEARG